MTASIRRPLRRIAAAVVVTVAALAPGLVPAVPGPVLAAEVVALAEPVASNDQLYGICGRVFPDPQAFGPAPTQSAGRSPYAKGNAACSATDFISYEGAIAGLAYLQRIFPNHVEVVDLSAAEYDDLLDRSLGEGRSAGIATATLGRESVPLTLVKVTDRRSAVPERERAHFVFPLSIHGIEKAGVEGGLRALEDLATWGARTPARPLLETGIGQDDIDAGLRNLPVGEVLERSVSYFVLANPDGWRRGDKMELNPSFSRFNGNGVDLNRDWPELGYTERPYTPWSEPESRSIGRVLQDIRPRWTGGIDLHGQLIDRAFSFTLIGGSQRPYDKNERVMQFVENAYQDAEERLRWSSLIKPNDAPDQCVRTGLDAGTGDDSPPNCDNRLYGVQYGTIWDTIDYTVSGAFGNWIDSPLGLDADGIDNEMSLSHLTNCATGTCYIPEAEQLHVDGNKSLIYAMLNFSLQPPEAEFDLDGDVGFLVNPRRLVDAGRSAPTSPDPALRPQPGQTTSVVSNGVQDPTVEFDLRGPADGFYNGGVSAQVTFSNVQGAGQGTVTVFIEQLVGTTWTVREQSLTQGAIYNAAGYKADLNFPQPGRYRVRVDAAVPAQVNLALRFTSAPAWPDPGQLPVDVSNMDFFRDLAPFVGPRGRLLPVSVDAVLDGTFDLDTLDSLIAVDDAFVPGFQPVPDTTKALSLPPTDFTAADRDAMAAAVRGFAERGGNVVLTDDSMRALEWMGLVPAGAVQRKVTYAGHVAFTTDAGATTTYADPLAAGIDRPGAAEGANNRRQITEPVPLGYRVARSASGSDANGSSPEWFVNRAAFATVTGARAVGTEGTGAASADRIALGEIPVGEGQVRFLGSFTPFPTDRFAHPYGLSSYAVTYSGYELARNLMSHQNPAQTAAVEPVAAIPESPLTPLLPVLAVGLLALGVVARRRARTLR